MSIHFLQRRKASRELFPDVLPRPGETMPEALASMAPESRPQPVFTPRPPARTRPMTVVPGGTGRPGRHAAREPRRTPGATRPSPARSYVPQPPEVLAALLDGLRKLPSPAAGFAADIRRPSKGGLPVFSRTVRRMGWRGLHMAHRHDTPVTLPARSGARWDDAMTAIAIAAENAFAQIRDDAAAFDAHELLLRERRAAAAENAPALGWPAGGDL